MPAFQMRYLLLSSGLFFLTACGSVYRKMEKVQANAACVLKFKPVFTKALYNTTVDVVGKHLSGLLLIKAMPDSSTRLVFSNEMGFKYFDFEFSAAGVFKVYYILPQMDKKAVLTTLRKDFELVMMLHLDTEKGFTRRNGGLLYHGFPQSKGNNYYITDSSCTRLIRLERASAKKPVVTAVMQQYAAGVPDTIGISHTGFNFTIGLKKLKQ
ncbi:MAG: hypothetical protein ABIQ88_08020 [Chitinophagaceae bacterium]